MFSATLGPTLDRLQRVVADIGPSRMSSLEPDGGSLRLGVPALDAALQGGLALRAVHELVPASPLQLGSAFGFALAIAALAAADDRHIGQNLGRQVLCIQTDFAALEAGTLHGPGLELFGLSLNRLLIVRVAHARDALWAFEEALKCPALAATVAELPEDGAAADHTATRRLTLAAQAGGGLGLLLRHQPYPLPSAAATRWQVAAAVSKPDRFGGLGRTRFDLSLNRNRRGHCGCWTLCWNHDERTFVQESVHETLSLGLAATARDRPDDARPFRRAG
jgi:protein ImuA